ncbi:MAG: cysteine hydrolase [Anaerolineaceae bacterium]|nr:cysteine hydrolase [Anaerolineaceae bacterium]
MKASFPQKSAAILVIDAQNDFLSPGAPYSCINTQQTITNIAAMLHLARQQKIPIIFTREAHAPDGRDYGMETIIGEPPHCVTGTPGIEIVEPLTPLENEAVIDKTRYDGFLGTPLDLLLHSLGRPSLFVTGFTTNACVLYTTMGAFQRDFPVHVIEECVSGTSQKNHELGLNTMRSISDEIMISLQTAIQLLSNQ